MQQYGPSSVVENTGHVRLNLAANEICRMNCSLICLNLGDEIFSNSAIQSCLQSHRFNGGGGREVQEVQWRTFSHFLGGKNLVKAKVHVCINYTEQL